VAPAPSVVHDPVHRVLWAVGDGRVRLEMADLHPDVPDALHAEADVPRPDFVGQTHAADARLPVVGDPPPGAGAAAGGSAQEPLNFPMDLADSVGVAVPGRKGDRL